MWLLKSKFRKKDFISSHQDLFRSVEVQKHGLNFIYDMQTCSATQFDMNLSKKVLKFLQVIDYLFQEKNHFILLSRVVILQW